MGTLLPLQVQSEILHRERKTEDRAPYLTTRTPVSPQSHLHLFPPTPGQPLYILQ